VWRRLATQRAASLGGWRSLMNVARRAKHRVVSHLSYDDVDAHFERAEREGAAVLSAPKDRLWGCAATPPSIRKGINGSSPP
jgi:predicted enzyme related to lactoylglutathione lyase